MSDEDWEKLDHKTIAMIQQYLVDTLYFMSRKKSQSNIYEKSFMIYMNMIQHSINYF